MSLAALRAGNLSDYNGIQQQYLFPAAATTASGAGPLPQFVVNGTTVTLTSAGVLDTVMQDSMQIKVAACSNQSGDGHYFGYLVVCLQYTTGGADASAQVLTIRGLLSNLRQVATAQTVPPNAVLATAPFCNCLSLGVTNKVPERLVLVAGSNPTFTAAVGIGPDLQITINKSVTNQAYATGDAIFLLIEPTNV